jgi:hypothetical protein
LWGHFDIGSCKKIEFEADSFSSIALGMLASKQDSPLSTTTTVAGISLVIVTLDILESFFKLNSDTHPTARERLSNILEGYENKEIHTLYYYFINGFIDILNPALEDGWDFRLREYMS